MRNDVRGKTYKSTKSKNDNEFNFYKIASPFADISEDDLAEALKKAGKKFEHKFSKKFKELSAELAEVDPLQLISTLAVYGLFSGVSEDSVNVNYEKKMGQSHVELAQAILLKSGSAETAMFLSPDKMQQVWDLLIEVSEAFALKRLKDIVKGETKESKAQKLLQERLRLHTQGVRNWGFYKFVVNTLQEIYEPLDDLFFDSFGARASTFINVFDTLVSRGEENYNIVFGQMREVFALKTIEDCVAKYHELRPELVDSREDLIKWFRDNKYDLKGAKLAILAHSDLRLTNQFVFTAVELADLTGVDISEVGAVFSNMSMKIGSLVDENPEYFFLDNPVWDKPIIDLENGSFFCAIPQVFFSFSLRIMNRLVENIETLRTACDERKAEYLEEAVARAFLEGFDGCNASRNVKWKEEGVQYETDLVVKIDSLLFIVEAKSGTISDPALRGAPSRARRHIEKLLIQPAIQSFRFANRINKIISGELVDNDLVGRLPFGIADVKRIIRLSITLEDFATIQSNVRQLEDTGWLPEFMPFAPTMCLSDMAVVFNMLSDDYQKIHYLVRRAEIESNLNYLGDELDLLGLYLENCFNIGNIEFAGAPVNLVGVSKKVDDYFLALDHDLKPIKPVISITKWWEDIIKCMEKRRIIRWFEAAMIMLNVPLKDQNKLQKKFYGIINHVRKCDDQDRRKCFLVYEQTASRKEAVVLHAFRSDEIEKRRELVGIAGNHAFDIEGVMLCLVISLNVDKMPYPYSMLSVLERKDDELNNSTKVNT